MPRRFGRFDAAHSPWPMLIALIASVPAFYDSMMPTPATWATWMYLLSGTVVLVSAWRVRRAVRSRGTAPDEHSSVWGHHPMELRLDWFLGGALLLNAVLPQSNESEPALIWRLAIAVLMLYRLLKISKPLFTETGLARLLAMGATVIGLCGIGFYWLDPGVSSLHEGLWLAFSTAATVGYGDVVPTSTASRVFSVWARKNARSSATSCATCTRRSAHCAKKSAACATKSMPCGQSGPPAPHPARTRVPEPPGYAVRRERNVSADASAASRRHAAA